MHRDITCQQCHTDYRYDDKPSVDQALERERGHRSAAMCHQNAKKEKNRDPVEPYKKSIHAEKIREGDYKSATCGSCHGGHFIYTPRHPEAPRTGMHDSALRVCARCHVEQYASYDDYYHGRAYKQGAPDAPACWQCHKSHEVLPKADPASSVSAKNIGTTCAQQGCHKGSNEQFGADAGSLIHRKTEAQKANPIVDFLTNLFNRKSS